MAILTYGPLADEVRGSVGGVTFSNSHSGPTVKAKARPPYPQSTLQNTSKAYLQRGINFWNAESSGDKALWHDYAATCALTNSLGQTYYPTALQAYVWSCAQQLNAALSPDLTPPGATGLVAYPTLTLDYNAHNLRLTAMAPAGVLAEKWYAIAYYPDTTRAFNRRRRHTKTTFSGNVALPLTLAVAIDGGLAVGLVVTSHVLFRMWDSNRRIGIDHKISLTFTVA